MYKRCKNARPQKPWASQGVISLVGPWLCLVFLVLSGSRGAWAVPQEDTRLHKDAKAAIYQKEWVHAMHLLGELEKRFPNSPFRAEVLYWSAFTLDKLSHQSQKFQQCLARRVEALDFLNRLIHDYPDNPWFDDAKILRIAIAVDLTLMGRKDFQEYIIEAIGDSSKENLELKLIALDALLVLDRPRALAQLVHEYLNTREPGIRENIVFILRRANEEHTIQKLQDTRYWQGKVEIEESNCKINRNSWVIDPHLPLRRVQPEYPPEALSQGLGGTVVFNILIDRRGRISQVNTTRVSHPLLKEAAKKALQQWRYAPYFRSDTREDVVCTISFKFFITLK